jgi:predicted amidophosphoribosyltransferase
MPDESCRRCGGTLIKFSLCAECRRTMQQVCPKCGLITVEKLHRDYFYAIEPIQVASPHLVILE